MGHDPEEIVSALLKLLAASESPGRAEHRYVEPRGSMEKYAAHVESLPDGSLQLGSMRGRGGGSFVGEGTRMIFLLSIIGWFIVDLVLEVAGEGLLELTRVLNEEEAARPVAIAWFVVLGLALGAASTMVAGERVIQEGPFLGVSLVVVPALLGGSMEACGRLRSAREHRISHLATWYGGASMGLGLAAGRLGVMLVLNSV
jgi:hypothetical protein